MSAYHKIFQKQEFKTILGKNWSNFWILFIVLFLSIGSLSFSRAGLDFLRKKMEDPFINWIDVKLAPNLDEFYDDLDLAQNKTRFEYSKIERNNFILEYVFNQNKGKIRVEGRTIESNSSLFEKILEPNNLVVKRTNALEDNDFGWVVTADLMNRLGYPDEKNYPLFLSLTTYGDTKGLDSLGITNYKGWQEIPIPIIAVVKQLPDVLDFLTTPFFSEQFQSDDHPFNISIHPEYFKRIQFVVNIADENNLQEKITQQMDAENIHYEWENTEDYNAAFRDAKRLSLIVYDTVATIAKLNAICNQIILQNTHTYRYYDYAWGAGRTLTSDYISIMFDQLDKVKEFQQWAKDEFGIRIDMAQIEAKENFYTFNILATLLCMAICVISIFFILIFLYFLINAHFQKISKNLGTIMAFGLGNTHLLKIYLFVFMKLILYGLFTATMLLFILQYVFDLIGLVRANAMPYLNMFDGLVITVLLGIVALSAIVIYRMMDKKLRSTPGDLIYERNK